MAMRSLLRRLLRPGLGKVAHVRVAVSNESHTLQGPARKATARLV